MINLNGIEEQLSIEQDFFLLLCFSSRTGLSICFRNRRVFEYQENCDVSSKNSRQRVNQRKQVGGISVEADCYTIRSHCRKQRRRKTQILIELQLISPFEDCPDRGVLLRQPSLVILLSHFWRWRGNSTLHSLSSPTSLPYSHTNADKALRGESASSRRFAVSFLPPEAPSQAALLPPISFPLGHLTSPTPTRLFCRRFDRLLRLLFLLTLSSLLLHRSCQLTLHELCASLRHFSPTHDVVIFLAQHTRLVRRRFRKLQRRLIRLCFRLRWKRLRETLLTTRTVT